MNFQIFYYLKHSLGRQLSINDKVEHIRYFVNNFLGEKRNYQKYNDMRGCLISCYKECQRRLGINPTFLCDIMESYDEEINAYEDKKIDENGDVL